MLGDVGKYNRRILYNMQGSKAKGKCGKTTHA